MPQQLLRRTAQALKEDPFEAAVAFAAAFNGVFALTAPQGPSALISRLLPMSLERAWGVYLLLGGIAVVVGLLVRQYEGRVTRGYRVESAGLALLGPASVVYSGVAIVSALAANDFLFNTDLINGLISVSYVVVNNLAFALACFIGRMTIRERVTLLKAVKNDYR